MVLVGNLGQVELGGAILLHVLHPCIAEHLWSNGGCLELCYFTQGHHVLLDRVLAVVVLEGGRGGRVCEGGSEGES